jgi:hypothetical protein
MAAFSATLSLPAGQAAATNYQCRSGSVYTPASNGQVTVTSEGDYTDLVKQGWAVVSVTRG